MFNILIKHNAFKLCTWLMASTFAFPAILPSNCCCTQVKDSSLADCSSCTHCSTEKLIQGHSCCKTETFSSEETLPKTPCTCQSDLEIPVVLLEDKSPTKNIVFHELFNLKSLDEVVLIRPVCPSGTISECPFASSLERCISLSCFTL